MALFGSDTLSTGADAPATPLASTTSDLCVVPPHGQPSYNRVVLDTLLGEGRITTSEYNRVKSGALSIVDLSINSDELARLRCDAGEGSNYDPHFDPDLKPTITSVKATINATFTSGTKPTDKAHRIDVETTTAVLAAADVICRVNFAREYEDDGGVVAPVVTAVCETDPVVTFAVKNVTSEHFDLCSLSGMGAGGVNTVGITVSQVRR